MQNQTTGTPAEIRCRQTTSHVKDISLTVRGNRVGTIAALPEQGVSIAMEGDCVVAATAGDAVAAMGNEHIPLLAAIQAPASLTAQGTDSRRRITTDQRRSIEHFAIHKLKTLDGVCTTIDDAKTIRSARIDHQQRLAVAACFAIDPETVAIDAGSEADRVIAAFVVDLFDLYAGGHAFARTDQVGVVTRSAEKRISAGTTIESVIAGKSSQHVIAGKPADTVCDPGAMQLPVCTVMPIIIAIRTVDIEPLGENFSIGHYTAVGEADLAEYGCGIGVLRIEILEVNGVARRIGIRRVGTTEIDQQAAAPDLDVLSFEPLAQNQYAGFGALFLVGGIDNGVFAVALVEEVDVLAGTADQGVIALAADQGVVTGPSFQNIALVTAIKRIVTATTIDLIRPVAAKEEVVAVVGHGEQGFVFIAPDDVVAFAAEEDVAPALPVEEVVPVAAVDEVAAVLVQRRPHH